MPGTELARAACDVASFVANVVSDPGWMNLLCGEEGPAGGNCCLKELPQRQCH